MSVTGPAEGPPSKVGVAVTDVLTGCASLDAQWITVESYKGQVVLRGSVRSRPECAQAEAIAWCAPGVTEVINHDDTPQQVSRVMNDNTFVRSIYFFDPDGILLEFAGWTRELT